MDLYLVDFECETSGDSKHAGSLNRLEQCLIRESARRAAESGIVVKEIHHSDTLPAEQAARIYARHLDSPSGDIQVETLAPGASIEDLTSRLKRKSGAVMLIAEHDFLCRLVGRLVANDPELDLVTFAGKRVVHLNCSKGNWTVIAGGEGNVRRVRLRDWLHDFFDSILSLDGRFQATLRTLLFEPGRLSTEWLAGNRTLYAPPLRIYIVCSAIFFGIGFLYLALDDRSPLMIDYDVDTAVQATLINQLGDNVQITSEVEQILVEAIWLAPYLTIAMVPVLALVLMLVFRRKAYLYLEHLVFAVHVKSFWFLCISLAAGLVDIPLQVLQIDASHISNVATVIVIGIGLIYSIKAVGVFYSESWKSATLKVVSTFFVYFLSLFTAIMAAGILRVAVPTPDLLREHDRYWQVMESWHEDEPVRERDIHEAIAAYLRLPGYDYARPHTQLHVSELLMVAGQIEEARNKVVHVLSSKPDSAYGLAVAAGVNCKLEDKAEAREALESYCAVYDKLHAENNPPNHGRHQSMVEHYLTCAKELAQVDGEGCAGS